MDYWSSGLQISHETTRREYGREGLRYASDVTDEEWELIAAELPPDTVFEGIAVLLGGMRA